MKKSIIIILYLLLIVGFSNKTFAFGQASASISKQNLAGLQQQKLWFAVSQEELGKTNRKFMKRLFKLLCL